MEYPQLQDELVAAVRQGDEAGARALVSRLGTQPRKARALFEAMLTDSSALVRQAGAFSLGELGGAASARRLEEQLALEEARGDYDGESVAEAITRALGRIEEAGARASLVRRLERLVAGSADPSDLGTVARALWKRRHPDLLPAVQRSLERLGASAPRALHGLRLLLEKPPEQLREWAREPSASLEHKTGVLYVLEEDLPEALLTTLPSFIAAGRDVAHAAASQQGAASSYCDRLLSLFLLHRKQVLAVLSDEARSALRDLARILVAATPLNCAVRAAALLEFIGHPEDAALLQTHRPADPVLARVFDTSALHLLNRQES